MICPVQLLEEQLGVKSIALLVAIALLAFHESPSAAAAAQPPITAMAFSPDGSTLLVGSQHGVRRYSWPGRNLLGTLSCALSHVHDLQFSPDGRHLVAAGGTPGESGTIELFDWPSGRSLSSLQLHDDLVYQVAWSGNGQQLATAGADQLVGLVDVHHGSPGMKTRYFKGHSRPVLAVTFLPRDGLLASAGIDQSLRLWDVASGKLQRTLDNHTSAVHDLELRPQLDDSLTILASAGADRTVRLWQPAIGRLVRFARLDASPVDIAWTNDAKFLVAACDDGRLRVIDALNVQVVKDIKALEGWAYAVLIAPGGRQAVVGGAGAQLKVIDLDDRGHGGR